MIDFVHLACDAHIRRNELRQLMWYRDDMPDGEETHVHVRRGVRVRYYPQRGRLTIKGKILMLLHDTQVLNVDDIYKADIDRFISEINEYLNHLFTRPMLDIRWFKVKRIDYCFNVETEYVKTYLDFMTKALALISRGNRINYTQEKKFKGSVYAKTKSDYDQNERRYYVLNFYDKTDQLTKRQKRGQRVTEADFKAAKNILRLEVQFGYQLITQLCERLSIENSFGNLFDYAVAVTAEEMVYSRVFGFGYEQDFYSYQAAKLLLPLRSEAARKALYSASTNHRIRGKKYAYGRKVIKDAGIYPYCFLPDGCGVDRLDNPLKLIQQKLEAFYSESKDRLIGA